MTTFSPPQTFKIELSNPNELFPYENNPKTHPKKQIAKIARSINEFGLNNPVLIDETSKIIAGEARVEAAKTIGLKTIPTITLAHLTEKQIKAYRIADNKLAEEGIWDQERLKIEFELIIAEDIDIELTGFEIPEIDLIINDYGKNSEKPNPIDKLPKLTEIERKVQTGEVWQLGNHALICGDALLEVTFSELMGEDLAGIVFSDPPYNVKIKGNVSTNKNHPEFAMASGKMAKNEFSNFLEIACSNLANYSKDGSIHNLCMDWRHVEELIMAGKKAYTELKNICVWDKGTAGMGSLYRSQHEFVLIFKNGTAPHINNVELGKHGRYRTNVWKYKGMHASNPEANELVKLHPTVKPVAMIMDALLDCSNPGDIVLDCFGGSGSTLLAAERTKRIARIIELDPHYCDVIIHRYEKLTKNKAKCIKTRKDGVNGK